jgi:hypothetical protein
VHQKALGTLYWYSMKEECARRELRTVDETVSANFKTANVCRDATDSVSAIQLMFCNYTIELAGGGALRPASGDKMVLSLF